MIGKHTQGSEVKAITYSAMQIYDRPVVNRPEVFVIVDVWHVYRLSTLLALNRYTHFPIVSAYR